MTHVPRASIADDHAGADAPAGAVTSSASPLEEPGTPSWYDADAVTFAADVDAAAPAWNRAWPPETRSLESHVRALVVEAQSGRR